MEQRKQADAADEANRLDETDASGSGVSNADIGASTPTGGSSSSGGLGAGTQSIASQSGSNGGNQEDQSARM
jgi:hypothetical protein